MMVPIHALQWYRFADTVNYGFGDVEETGILIAIDEILEEKRVRHINSFIEEHPEALKITSGANNVIYKEKDIQDIQKNPMLLLLSANKDMGFFASFVDESTLKSRTKFPPLTRQEICNDEKKDNL